MFEALWTENMQMLRANSQQSQIFMFGNYKLVN